MSSPSLAPAFARRAALTAGLMGATAIACGAFGAHGLRELLPATHLAWWKTASDYHILHALFLLGLASASRPASRLLRAAFGLTVFGVGVFSGSLYAMALSDLRWLGAITPIGGTSLIAAWILAGLALARGLPPSPPTPPTEP
jgi:uncharacterized membrane protein YgdD (TMEM256/DUF423 family)